MENSEKTSKSEIVYDECDCNAHTTWNHFQESSHAELAPLEYQTTSTSDYDGYDSSSSSSSNWGITRQLVKQDINFVLNNMDDFVSFITTEQKQILLAKLSEK